MGGGGHRAGGPRLASRAASRSARRRVARAARRAAATRSAVGRVRRAALRRRVASVVLASWLAAWLLLALPGSVRPRAARPIAGGAIAVSLVGLTVLFEIESRVEARDLAVLVHGRTLLETPASESRSLAVAAAGEAGRLGARGERLGPPHRRRGARRMGAGERPHADRAGAAGAIDRVGARPVTFAMARIAVLPPAVADQIAAGEVVERPASVVKELVENALDAGRHGDRRRGRGGWTRSRSASATTAAGMERDDALLALERHATSKIRSAADLVGVSSFGFRGEALPAICSVVALVIETAPADGAGTRDPRGGRRRERGRATSRAGEGPRSWRLSCSTTRRRGQKFLRGARSEWRGVVEAMTTVALTRRDVRFTVSTRRASGARAARRALPARPRRRRSGARPSPTACVDVDDVRGAIHVSGLVERPARRRHGEPPHLPHRERPRRSATPGMRARRGGRLSSRRFAAGCVRRCCSTSCSLPIAVDVNVHPAKAEVRFRDRWVRGASRGRRASGARSAPSTRVRRSVCATWSPTVPRGAPRAPMSSRCAGGRRPEACSSAAAPSSAAGRSASTTNRTPRANASRGVPGAALPRGARRRRRCSTCRRCSSCGARTCCSSTTTASSSSTSTRRTSACCTSDSWARSSGARRPSQRLLFPADAASRPRRRRTRSRRIATRSFASASRSRASADIRCSCSSVPMPHPRFDAERCLRETLAALARRSHARRRTRGTSDSPRRSRARRRSRRATRCRRPRCARCSSRSRDTRLPAHDVHGRSTIVQLVVGRARAPLRATVVRPRSRSSAARRRRARSALALGLAERTDVTIVSADSRQVYRGFDIGTAKPTAAERARVPHCGIDVARPDAARTRRPGGRTRCRRVDRDARARRRTPLVVGGTGLYLRALFDAALRGAAARPSCVAWRSARAVGADRRPRRCAAGRASSIRRGRTSVARSCCGRSRSRSSPGGA